jgi:hypothetical protein
MKRKPAEKLRVYRETVLSLDPGEPSFGHPQYVVGGRTPNTVCECSENGCISRAAD